MRTALFLLALLLSGPALAEAPTRGHAVSIYGTPALPPDFAHFPYANPDAPKGGDVALAAVGSFDSFNPFIVRGTAAAGVSVLWDTLLRANADEANAAYGHIARTVEIAPDRMWVAFELRPEARFHDGAPITAEDAVWTFDALRAQGRPFYRAYYADVTEAVAEGPRRVVFRFRSNANRELPLILGQMPVLPKHWWQGRDFSRPLTDPPLGSGPYRVGRFEFGRTVAYERVPEYWAANLPTGRGLANFGTLRHEYFRDATVAQEAFKAGQIDFRQENIAKEWATGYDFAAVKRGLVKREEIQHRLPTGLQGFFMNTRRDVFKDRRVREAMVQVFDFEWLNRNIFYGAYTRTSSYFSNSELASSGLPQGAELALLEPHRAALPPELFTQEYKLPVTDGSGNNREGLRRALALLKEAGWEVKERKLVNREGRQMSFELLLDSPTLERLALPYVQWVQRLGIDARVRTVDPAQYQRLTDAFDFDMTTNVVGQSEHPGNEQTEYWTCASARQEGSQNIAGVCDPAVDALVERVVNAGDYDALLAATRALDRVLLWGTYAVPHYHSRSFRLAYWDRFARVNRPVRAGFVFDAWWIDPAHADATDAARRAGQ